MDYYNKDQREFVEATIDYIKRSGEDVRLVVSQSTPFRIVAPGTIDCYVTNIDGSVYYKARAEFEVTNTAGTIIDYGLSIGGTILDLFYQGGQALEMFSVSSTYYGIVNNFTEIKVVSLYYTTYYFD